MDPFTTAVIGWATNQVGAAGVHGLRRLLGDKQRDSLRKVVRVAIESAVDELVTVGDRAAARDALRAGSAEVDAGGKDLLDLRDAILRQVGPALAALRQQGCDLEPDRLVDVLTAEIVLGIKADAARGGPLKPLAELLWQERVAAALEIAGTPRPVPRELPRPVADFTGRAEELTALCGRLAAGAQALDAARGLDASIASAPVKAGEASGARSGWRGGSAGTPSGTNRAVAICAVDGMGGVGKSALAIQAANMYADSFPGGQLYVNLQGATPGLSPLDPLDALGHMLRALGCDPAAIPGQVDEAAARFRSLAAGRRLLILLDNAGNAQQVRPLLPAGPGSAVLITSRRPLVTLEGVYALHLEVLPEQHALELLGQMAGPERMAAQPQAAVAVTRWCGCLPLAIRIAGARLTARPAWPIAALADLLADASRRLDTLESLAMGDMAVRRSFDISLHALQVSPETADNAAAAAFGLLSLADGSDIDVLAAAAMLDQPERYARVLLERLVDAQLLETPCPGRYQFHDLLRLYGRQFAAERHSEQDRLTAVTRLITFYTATAWRSLLLFRPGDHRLATADSRWTGGGQVFSDVAQALEWTELEHSNLLAAVGQAASAAPAVPAELAGQLTRALSACLDRRGYWQDLRRASQVVLELAQRGNDRVGQAYAHSDLGFACRRLGRYREATTNLEAALSLFRELDDLPGQAYSLGNLGNVHSARGHYQQAIDFQKQSLGLWQGLRDLLGQATSLLNLGHAYRSIGRYDAAITALEESLGIWAQRSDRRGRATSLGILGTAYRELGRLDQAVACHQESLSIARELGDLRTEALSLNDLGFVYARLDRTQEALGSLRQSLLLSRQIGYSAGQMRALRDLGDTLLAAGDQRQARAAWQQALDISRTLETPDNDELISRLGIPPPITGIPGER
jgi:tetratricopeptide (TPR) repeat protein